MAEKIRVMVVDDSAFMRRVISDILNGSGDIEVVGTARNGAEALEKIKELAPDVVTLDVEMPVMDGITCLRKMLSVRPIPVIMLSSVTREGADSTLNALEYGAVDFITKPTGLFKMSGEDKKKEIIEKVKIAKISSINKRYTRNIVHTKPKDDIIKSSNITKLVAIGTSTGGPRALQEVICGISGNIPAAFLIVQHMPPGFTKSLADRLNGISELTVKEAEDGELLKAGYAYIAPGDYHMRVYAQQGGLVIKLTREPPVSGHRPSVNVMMDSLSETGLKDIIAVIMTGMGSDGSEGVKKLKSSNNGYVIAQDEKSCVVYGMPKSAVQTGAVDAVVPLKEITKEISRIVGVLK